MVIVAFDPNNETVIRQIYIKPKGVMTQDAIDAIEQAYDEASVSGLDAIQILESKGYTLAEWMSVEVDDS